MMERDEKGCWLPGVSPNPSGRPPGSVSLESRLRKRLRENPKEADRIIDTLIAKALGKNADAAFVKILLDRHDGPVRKTVLLPDAALEVIKAVAISLAAVYPEDRAKAERFLNGVVERLKNDSCPLNSLEKEEAMLGQE